MKILPRLILPSLCALLASVVFVEAQAPQPRFGYGSVPRGDAVIPAPKTSKAAPSSKPKSKPVVASISKPKPKANPSKPKTVVSTGSSGKTSPGKVTAKATLAKPASGNAAKKDIVSAKSKPIPAKAAKPTLAKASLTSSSSSRTMAAAPSKPVVKPSQTGKSGQAEGNSAMVSRKSNPSPTADAKYATTGPGDLTRATAAAGFHFFGTPIVLPEIPAASAASSATDSRNFVNLKAARQSLVVATETFKPRLPLPKPVVAQSVPSSSPKVSKPVRAASFVERPLISAEDSAPEISPGSLGTPDFQATMPAPSIGVASPDLLDEPTLARTAPVSLGLAPVSRAAETIPETALPEEPRLPSPVVSIAENASPPPSKSKPTAPPEPPLPTQTPAPAALPEVLANAADQNDLSDRERAFVRSLAEAASSVTSASGRINQDLPASITTAATSVLDQIPAQTVSTFRAVARNAKSAKSAAKDMVPELPMELSNDLMPATPDQLPDQLPSFNAASSGKIDVQSDRQADYDQANNKVIFTGKVELNSAAIRLRAERVEVFMKKGGGGMERVEATGKVLMRTQDTEGGPGQMASAGRASYNLKTGEITLSDWPKIQEAGKSHISTDPSTKMFMFTDGRLRTDGPNRTLIGGE